MDKIIIRTYTGSQANATARYQADSVKMANQGYFPTSQSWAPGQWGCGAFLVALLACLILIGFIVFIFMLLVKPDGTLSVTYELRADLISPEKATSVEEKTCPQCAEQVKAAALVCRFCGHKFTPIIPWGTERYDTVDRVTIKYQEQETSDNFNSDSNPFEDNAGLAGKKFSNIYQSVVSSSAGQAILIGLVILFAVISISSYIHDHKKDDTLPSQEVSSPETQANQPEPSDNTQNCYSNGDVVTLQGSASAQPITLDNGSVESVWVLTTQAPICVIDPVFKSAIPQKVAVSQLQIIGVPPPAGTAIELKGTLTTENVTEDYAEPTAIKVISGQRITNNTASFDCTHAHSTLEILICADPDLAALDGQEGDAYNNLKSTSTDDAQKSAQLLSEQRQFLKERSVACPIPYKDQLSDAEAEQIIGCLKVNYSARLDDLKALYPVNESAHPAWLDKQQAWGKYLGGGSEIVIATSQCAIVELKEKFPYAAAIEEPVGGYPGPTGHVKYPTCWKWDLDTVIFPDAPDQMTKENNITVKPFDKSWDDFTIEWYQKDWPNKNDE